MENWRSWPKQCHISITFYFAPLTYPGRRKFQFTNLPASRGSSCMLRGLVGCSGSVTQWYQTSKQGRETKAIFLARLGMAREKNTFLISLAGKWFVL